MSRPSEVNRSLASQHYIDAQYSTPQASIHSPSPFSIMVPSRQFPRRDSSNSVNSQEKRARKAEIEKRIWTSLRNSMKRPDEAEKTFICEDDLIQVSDDMRDLLAVEYDQHGRIDEILERSLRVMALLCWIRSSTIITSFQDVLFGRWHNSTLILTDERLYGRDEIDLDFLDDTKKQRFLEDRWIFRPVKIEEGKYIIWPRSDERLPWEEEYMKIGVGGYGTIKKVKIPPRYHVMHEADNIENVNNKPRYIACKHIESTRANEDFEKEVRTLSILKESLTTHQNIMRHIGFLVHNHNYFILLPLALGDLDLFFYEGNQKLEPNDPFMEMVRSATPANLMTQSLQLASALKWLHMELQVPGEPDLSCIHMDLKPENILIMPDDSSPIGTFKLADFGISAINSSSGNPSETASSIGDAYDWLRSKCRPQRTPGTFQAPEVQKGASHVVGKKSDVWSFACVFSMIATFALGKRELLEQFDKKREISQESYTNDYFYTVTQGPGSVEPVYKTRREVLQWLDDLVNSYGPSQNWVLPAVKLIKDCLIVSQAERPGVEKLVEGLNHLNNLLSRRRSSTSQLKSNETTKEDENSGHDSLGEPELRDESNKRQPDNLYRASTSPNNSPDSSSAMTENPLSSPSIGSRTDRLREASNSFFNSQLDSFDKDLQHWQPTLESWVSELTSKKHETYFMTVSPLGDRVAWIQQNSVHVFDLRLAGRKSSKQVIQLPGGIVWKYFAICNCYLAAAGNLNGATVVHRYNMEAGYSQAPQVFNAGSIITLNRISISPQGRVLLVSNEELKVLGKHSTCSSELAIENFSHLRLPTQTRHVFQSATFSPTGENILAWSWGKGHDRFHSWSCEGDSSRWDYQHALYASNHYGSSTNQLVLLPYDKIRGCIMKSKDGQFFSVGLSNDVPKVAATKASTHISNVVLAKVFMDRWLITVEKNRLRKPELKRYLITADSSIGDSRTIGTEPYTIGRLQSSKIGPKSSMEVLCEETSVKIMICNADGSMEIVQLL